MTLRLHSITRKIHSLIDTKNISFIYTVNSFIHAWSTSFNDILHTFIFAENTFIYMPWFHSLTLEVLRSLAFCIHSFLLRIHSFTCWGFIHWHLKYFIHWHFAYIHFCWEYIHLHAGVSFIDTWGTSFIDILHTFIFAENSFIYMLGFHSLTPEVLYSMTFYIHSFLQKIHSFTAQGFIHWH